jgi:hypothetical protein
VAITAKDIRRRSAGLDSLVHASNLLSPRHFRLKTDSRIFKDKVIHIVLTAAQQLLSRIWPGRENDGAHKRHAMSFFFDFCPSTLLIPKNPTLSSTWGTLVWNISSTMSQHCSYLLRRSMTLSSRVQLVSCLHSVRNVHPARLPLRHAVTPPTPNAWK